MSAYVIVDIDVLDPVGYEEYKLLAPATLDPFGGKYIARGGTCETLEGTWQPSRLVILEFETMDKAKEWLNSSEYAPARSLRHKYAQTNMVLVTGL